MHVAKYIFGFSRLDEAPTMVAWQILLSSVRQVLCQYAAAAVVPCSCKEVS